MFWLRAVAAAELGDTDEALRAAGWVVRLDPDDPWAWVHVGDLYLTLGRDDLARAAAETALRQAPDLPEARQLWDRCWGTP